MLLRRIIAWLEKTYEKHEFAIVAPTGMAACTIGGTTIHYFAKMRAESVSAETYVKKATDIQKARWQKVVVLIIDEISMMSEEMFRKLEAIARGLRGNDKPWGGIHLVVAGDFYQLPPIEKGFA